MQELAPHKIVAEEDDLLEKESSQIRVFDGWEGVPANFKTREAWRRQLRRIPKGTSPRALVRVHEERKRTLTCGEVITPIISRTFSLFHASQTRPQRKTDLQIAQLAFYELYLKPASRNRHIRWTRGDWQEAEDGNRYWDATAASWGWRTLRGRPRLQDLADHLNGKEIYGVYGGTQSAYLLIDLDLHNVPLLLFLKRLAALIDYFHGRFACHFQVAEQARGIHLILHFCEQVPLMTNGRWIVRELGKLDDHFGDTHFTRVEGEERHLNIEIYPSANPHRLPLCKGRVMLLGEPLALIERRGRLVQDVAGYMRWLKDANRTYMDRDEVHRYVLERLDVGCSSTYQRPSSRSAQRDSQSPIPTPSKSEDTKGKGAFKGKLRPAIVGIWRDGELGPFRHLNDAINVTLRALYFEGLKQTEANGLLSVYLDEVPSSISTRLPYRKSEVLDVVRRDAAKIWNGNGGQRDPQTSSRIWRQTIDAWQRVGFRVSDKSTWSRSSSPITVVNCPDIEFSETERRLLISEMTPLLVGRKQATKPTKQESVIRAVGYFLRFVKCHGGEIAISWLPEILKDFDLKVGNHDKQKRFFNLLRQWEWIYLRVDYWHPSQYGEKGRGRARAYGIGSALSERFHVPSPLYTPPTPHRPIFVSHFLEESTAE